MKNIIPATKKCAHCGKLMVQSVNKNGYLNGDFKKRKFCSRLCFHSYKSDKSAPSDSAGKERAQKEMAHIKKCQICGNIKKLQVHHRDRNKKNNKPENLMKICQRCHMKIHIKAGDWGKGKKKSKQVNCNICGKSFIQRSRGNHLCNSIQCHSKSKRQTWLKRKNNS